LREAASDLTRDAVRFSDGNAVPLCRLVSGEDILMSEDEIVFGNFKMKQFSTNGVQRNARRLLFWRTACLKSYRWLRSKYVAPIARSGCVDAERFNSGAKRHHHDVFRMVKVVRLNDSGHDRIVGENAAVNHAEGLTGMLKD
jgi:hypothetical protein